MLCVGKAFIIKSVYNCVNDKYNDIKLKNMNTVLFDKKEQLLQSVNNFTKTYRSTNNLYFVKNIFTTNGISRYKFNFVNTEYYAYKSITNNLVLRKAKVKNMETNVKIIRICEDDNTSNYIYKESKIYINKLITKGTIKHKKMEFYKL